VVWNDMNDQKPANGVYPTQQSVDALIRGSRELVKEIRDASVGPDTKGI